MDTTRKPTRTAASVITRGDHAIHVKVGRPGAGLPVLLVHGMGGSHSTWRPLARELTAAGRTVISLDLRGHGRSSRAPGEYRVEEFAADVLAVIDHLGLNYFDLVSHSLGAAVAVEVASARPDAVRRLVLEEVPPKPRTKEEQNEVRDVVISIRDMALGIAKEFARAPRAILQFDRSMAEQVVRQWGVNLPWWDRLATLPHPTLVISGGPTSFIKPEHLKVVAEHLPAGEYLELDHGHAVHRDDEARYLVAVAEFLSRPEPARS